MPSPNGRIAKRATRAIPSPLLRWTARAAVRVVLPIAGAAATVVVQRAKWRLGSWRSPHGTVVVDINRDVRVLAPEGGRPDAALAALAERADLTLGGVPGRPVTRLRAVPRHPGDDIRADVALAKQHLEALEAEDPRLRLPPPAAP